jgi:hypothetical protein
MPVRQDQTPQVVTPQLMTAFERTITPERWRTYQRAAGFNEETAHRLYLWNAAVGQSFHYPLQTVEVALRNVVHQALQQALGPVWWRGEPGRAALSRSLLDDVVKVERRFRSKYQRELEAGQVVASLSLGFWVTLLKRDYHSLIWDQYARQAFPNLAEGEGLVQVYEAGKVIQNLRNRIFHQEPLIGRNLSADYAAILKMLGWICPETRGWVRYHASVPRVIRMRP